MYFAVDLPYYAPLCRNSPRFHGPNTAESLHQVDAIAFAAAAAYLLLDGSSYAAYPTVQEWLVWL